MKAYRLYALLIFAIIAILSDVETSYATLGFGTPAALNTNSVTDSMDDIHPRIATDGKDHWVAVWHSAEDLGGTGADSEIFVSLSSDNGTTWTDPATLNTNAATDDPAFGQDLNPVIATDKKGNWVVVWHSRENLGGIIGNEEDIFFSRSTNNGVTWTAPAVLNTNASTDSLGDLNPEIATDNQGIWIVVWESREDLGGIGTDSDIFVSRSTDNGVSWKAPEVLNSNAPSTGSDFNPQIATDKGVNWVVMWESRENLNGTAGTDDDIFVAHSSDNGQSWSDAEVLNTNAATDGEATDFNPRITTDSLGNWTVVWVSDVALIPQVGTDFDILFCKIH